VNAPVLAGFEAANATRLAGARVLIIVENLPLPFDRRVWLEARTLKAAGAKVSIICPTGRGYETRHEVLEGIDIYRHPLPVEADGAIGYLLEYGAALFWETVLAWRVFLKGGLDVIHGCNPPDLIFLVALPFRLFGVRYLFDHHDINPELYEAKYDRKGLFWKLMLLFERLTFKAARVSIATNESYRRIAMERGGKRPDDVFVVRSGPDLSKVKPVAPVDAWRNGRRFLVGYVGVMGRQEGIDLLLEAVREIVHVRGRQDVQFGLVGGGSSLEEMKALATKLQLDDYVTFTGRAPDQVLLEVLSTADVCVNPDVANPFNDRCTMNKIMEYMALGKPIVQFEMTEGRVSAGEASLYAEKNDPADMADKILGLLDDPEQRARMGALGRERVERELSWATQIEPLLTAYERVLAGKVNRARS
jgi:glycosyltransferase involved in cell wall biosynthesis